MALRKNNYFFKLFRNSEKNIEFIIDDNKLKQGLCIPGTKIKILGPQN